MLSETAHCPGWKASLICFRVIILNFVQVIYQFSSFRFIIKWLSPFFLGSRKGYEKDPFFPGPNSMVPSDSTELTSEVIMLSWAFGTFTSHLLVSVIKGSFWLKCSRCPCIVPNMKESRVIPIHSFTNLLSLPLLESSFCFHMVLEAGLLGPGMVLEGHLLAVLACQPKEMCLWLQKPWQGSCQLGSWHLGWAIPAYAGGVPILCGSDGLGRFFFCTFCILTGSLTSCGCSGLRRRLNTKSCSTLCGSNGPGMLISRPYLPMKDDVLQDPKPKFFKYISLWEEVVVLKGLWWRWVELSSLHIGPQP